ncbi:putative kinase-like protein [Toxocara canis]|uniref:Putative kinase-like protein n=1 Tax=Toxocara canis TaxID=6265 RepID=A0A0B2VFD2_TOXCA|nr:putative kinase-like protein [Toxocara canis]
MVNDGNTSEDVSEILGTSITWSWVEEKLKCKLQTKSCFGNGKKAVRIGIGQGFASIIGRLYLDWVPEDENLPQTVIIKIPSIESTMQLLEGLNSTRMLEEATSNDREDLLVKFTSVLQQCHNTEVSFYELLSSNGLHIKAPKAYVLQKFTKDCDQGVIVLSDQGDDVVVLMLFNNVTPDEIMQVFDSLAELHAYSLAHPECFDAVSPSSLSDLYQMHDQSKGFASIIGRLYLDWVPEDENLPQTVIIKIPSIESTKQLLEGLNSTRMLEEATSNDREDLLVKFTSVLQQCHNTEVSFYELLSSNGLHIKAPKAYVLQKFTKDCDQGVIVLSDQGDDVVVLMLFNNVTPDEIMQVFDSLAELHAYSLAHPECFDAVSPSSLSDLYQMHDQSKLVHPGTPCEDIARMMSSSLSAKDRRQQLDAILERYYTKLTEYLHTEPPFTFQQISRAMIKAIGNLDEEKLTTLTEQVNNCLDEIFDVEIIGRLHKEMGMKPVLVHGDLWSGNVIWRKDGERNKLAAIVDWQLVHPGTPCEDIARMMSSSLSAKDRRQQLDAILERYYTKLTEYLHTEPPFTFQQLKDSFIRIYPFAMLTIAPGLGPLVQMQVQSRSDEEQKQLKELMREKAIGLFEDILHYHRLNGLRNNA